MELIYLICAIFGSAVLLLQFGLQFMGLAGDFGDGADAGGDFGDGGGDFADGGDMADGDFGDGDVADGDVDHVQDGGIPLFKVISFQTIIAAFAFFGIAGKAASANDVSPTFTLVIAVMAGLAAMYVVYYLASMLHRFNADGTVRIRNAVGQPGTVYIPIPAGSEGAGKIQMTIQSRIMEFAAVTDDEERLPSGERVRVVEVLGPDTVKVERLIQSETTTNA